jgi:hypothetical protein
MRLLVGGAIGAALLAFATAQAGAQTQQRPNGTPPTVAASARPAARAAAKPALKLVRKAAPKPKPPKAAAPSASPASSDFSFAPPVVEPWIPYLVFAIPVIVGAVVVGAYLMSSRSRKPGRGATWSQSDRDSFEARTVAATMAVLVLFGLILTALVPGLKPTAWTYLALTCIGIMVAAGFFGFLFGLPHVNAGLGSDATAGKALLKPSTNLEQIADKLVQLLAGVALAELLTVPTYIGQFDAFVKTSLGGPALLGTAVMLYFAPLGFVLSYLLTRTVLSSAIAGYDDRLWRSGRDITQSFPVLPDVEAEPLPEQIAIAKQIVATPLTDLTDDVQRITWGRAQALLQNYSDAETAFQIAFVRYSNDARFLYDYATVLYNDTSFENPTFVLQLAERADALEAAAEHPDPHLRGRIRALMAATNLYGAGGGYVEAITTVNGVIRDPRMDATKVLRFYRACAFGQLYREEQPVAAPDLAALSTIINRDVTITLGYGPRYRRLVEMVTDPAKRGNADTDDNDLQTFAAADAALRTQLGMTVAPPPLPASGKRLRLPPPPAGKTAIQALVDDSPP